MEEIELFEQNPWWGNKGLIEEDYDIYKWKEKKYKWVPEIITEINLNPFCLHILFGPRQVGKTTLIKLLIRKLLETREPKSIFYFNCENVGDYKELLMILNMYLEFKKENSIKSAVILLDEITNPKEWYRAIKSLIDRGKLKDDVVILTGSSSIAIKKEVELFPGRRGGGKDFMIYPLSFRSFLRVVDEEIMQKIPCLLKIEDLDKMVSKAMVFMERLDRHLKDYMRYGGFPLSVVNLHKDKEEAKRTYLSWIKNAILKSERSDTIAKQIIKILVESLQSDLSWEGVSKKIEIKSPKTVASYVELLKSMFAVNVLYNIDVSGRRIRFGRNKKIHFRDPLLLEIFEEWCLTKPKNEQSAIAESLVVEHLSRMFPEKVFFWRNGHEIDAIILDKKGVYGFEVKWSEKTESKGLNQLRKFVTITKKEYSRKPLKVPLSVFLSLFEV